MIVIVHLQKAGWGGTAATPQPHGLGRGERSRENRRGQLVWRQACAPAVGRCM